MLHKFNLFVKCHRINNSFYGRNFLHNKPEHDNKNLLLRTGAFVTYVAGATTGLLAIMLGTQTSIRTVKDASINKDQPLHITFKDKFIPNLIAISKEWASSLSELKNFKFK